MLKNVELFGSDSSDVRMLWRISQIFILFGTIRVWESLSVVGGECGFEWFGYNIPKMTNILRRFVEKRTKTRDEAHTQDENVLEMKSRI
jgi:hypothetical protein